MKVLITGGTGFVGQKLAQALLARGTLTAPSGGQAEIDEMVLFDANVDGPLRVDDSRVRCVAGDIADQDTVTGLVDRDDISVFHLASVVSGGGEKDFDLAMRVNLHGALSLFEATRAREGLPRLVFASSIAVFGGAAMGPVVGDGVKQTPQTTYGMTKAVCELLINDYSRKGFFDGRSARLPTVIVRPGKPNLAASSFVSGVFREPLSGQPCVLPVGPKTVMPLLSVDSIVGGFVRLHEVDGADLGDDRAVSLPSLTVTVQDMIDSVQRVGQQRGLTVGEITVEPDPFIEKIVATWPLDASHDRALALGLPIDASLDDAANAFVDEHVT